MKTITLMITLSFSFFGGNGDYMTDTVQNRSYLGVIRKLFIMLFYIP